MAYHVTQANMNRRLRTVSLWSLQMTAGAMVSDAILQMGYRWLDRV
jgi:hypothetical protein